MSNFPYTGLRHFKRKESDIFFGRDEFVGELANKLNLHYFISIIGDSGCGKSSLVGAGLLSRLKIIPINGREHWRTALLRPGNKPFYNLSRCLLRDTKNPSKLALREEYLSSCKIPPENPISHLQQELKKDLNSSYQKLEEILPDNHSLLIVVDQFEELFHYAKLGDDQKQEVIDFVQWLLACSYHAKSRIYVVIAMRSEFLDECANYGDLLQAINDGFFQIPYLTPPQLEEAIKFPALVYEGQVDDKLVQKLLEDVKKFDNYSHADQLPLLQFALEQMWLQINCNPQKTLTLEHYEKLGGNLSKILSNALDKIYDDLTNDNRRIIEILFRCLASKDNNGNYIRNPFLLGQVAKLAATNPQIVETIADVFKDFLFSQNKIERNQVGIICFKITDTVDIKHESIIRQWVKLKQWADQESEWKKNYLRWEDAAQQHKNGKGDLRRSNYLMAHEDWLKEIARLYPTEKEQKIWASRYGKDVDLAWKFLEESRKAWKEELAQKIEQEKELEQVRQERARFKERAEWITIVLVIISLLSAWGAYEKQQAESAKKQTEVAKQQIEKIEQQRTEELFESKRKHSALLVKNEDYIQAKQVLEQSIQLDSKIAEEPRHARNLLASFVDLIIDKPILNYQGAKAVLYGVAISPDKKTLATVGENGTVALFNEETRELLQRFHGGHSGHVRKVIFDSKNQIITAGDDRQIIVWSMDGHILQQWKTDNEIKTLAVNSTGEWLFSAGSDRKITQWNVQSGENQTIFSTENAISNLVFNSDNSLLAVASDNKVYILQTNDWKVVDTLEQNLQYIQQIEFSSTGRFLAIASDDKVGVWDRENKTYRSFKGHKGEVFSVGFSKDERYVISGGKDFSLRIWDRQSGETMRVLQGHTGFVNGIVVDGNKIYSSSTDRTLKQWDINSQNPLRFETNAKPSAVAISPTGKHFMVGFNTGSLELRDVSGNMISEPKETHRRDVQRLAFSHNGIFVASASLDRTANVWKLENNQLTFLKAIEHNDGVNAVSFSPDNKLLLTASYDGQLGVLNLDTQETVFYQLYDANFNSVVWDKKGETFLTASDNQAYVWNANGFLKNGHKTPSLTYPEMPNTVVFWAGLSPNGQFSALAARDFAIQLYSNMNPPTLKKTFYGHKQTVKKVVFSPDNKQLASVAGDNTLKIWDLIQETELFSLALPSQSQGTNNSIYDFDFRCWEKEKEPFCWVAIPLPEEQQIVAYRLKF